MRNVLRMADLRRTSKIGVGLEARCRATALEYVAAVAERHKTAVLFHQIYGWRQTLFRKLNSVVILLYSACGDPFNYRGIDASPSASAANPRTTRITLFVCRCPHLP